jgi:hypothetical protein
VVIVEHIISYTCAYGAEHDIPSDEVRVLAWGATGFEVACICGPDPLAEADSPPHESVDHLAFIHGTTPSPREWLALDAAREGWYDENPWRVVESEGKTPLKLRGDIRDEMADLAAKIGVSPAAVAHWETRDVTPSPENAERLHEALQQLEYGETS